jgi:hypothetical protein
MSGSHGLAGIPGIVLAKAAALGTQHALPAQLVSGSTRSRRP